MQQPDMVTLPDITSIGLSIWDPVWALADHTSRANELLHVVKGTVRVHIGGHSYEARTGDTLFVPAGAVHRDEFPIRSQFEALLVEFTWDNTRVLPSARDNALLSQLTSRQRRELSRKVRELYEAFRGESDLAAEHTRALLYALLVSVKTLLASQSAGSGRGAWHTHERHAELLALARHYVAEHIHQSIGLADIAAHLGLSTYHLSHVFSQASGFSLSSYIMQKRMERAREMLMDPRMRVSEVAYAVGYADPNHFAKSYRRYFGSSPSQSRGRAGGPRIGSGDTP